MTHADDLLAGGAAANVRVDFRTPAREFCGDDVHGVPGLVAKAELGQGGIVLRTRLVDDGHRGIGGHHRDDGHVGDLAGIGDPLELACSREGCLGSVGGDDDVRGVHRAAKSLMTYSDAPAACGYFVTSSAEATPVMVAIAHFAHGQPEAIVTQLAAVVGTARGAACLDSRESGGVLSATTAVVCTTLRQTGQAMSEQQTRTPKLPPRWFIRSAWVLHRGLYRASRGRLGLRSPTPLGRFGMLRLTTIGRRSGEERVVILGYVEDGPNLVSLAMNGWADGDPAWWLNLQAHPDARVQLAGADREIRAHRAEGVERERLWALIDQYDGWGEGIDNFASLRSSETAVVVFAPQNAGPG